MNQTKPKQTDISPNVAFNYILENMHWEMRKMLEWLIENYLTHLKHGRDNFHLSFHTCLLGNLLAHKSVAILLYSVLSFSPHIAGSADLKSPSLLRLLFSSYFSKALPGNFPRALCLMEWQFCYCASVIFVH